MKFCSRNICLFFFFEVDFNFTTISTNLCSLGFVCLSIGLAYLRNDQKCLHCKLNCKQLQWKQQHARERETHIDTGSERETGRTRVDTAQIVHRFILCALLKYTTFNEFSINFDWHFSLHTSLGLGRLSDRISPAPNPRRVASLTFSHINGPGCGSVCSWRYVGLGHVKMIDFYTWDFYAKIKRGKRVETPKKTVLKFKHNNSRNDSMRQGVQGLLFHLVSQHQEGMSS